MAILRGLVLTGKKQQASLAQDIMYYLKHSKRWWLTPIIVVLLLLALVAVLAGVGPALPFIYTLF